MTRVKAVFCSLMSIKACATESSALQNPLTNAYSGPPYWIIDDAGMNITVFLNMTGYSAPNESATVLAPTVRYQDSFTTEQLHVGNSSGNQDETTPKGHYEVFTNEDKESNNVVPTASSVSEASAASTNGDTSTTSSYPEAITSNNPLGTVDNDNPGKNTTYGNVESTTSYYASVSTMSIKPEVPPTTHNPSVSTTQIPTTVTAEGSSESYKTLFYKNKGRPQMDYYTSQLIAETVSKAVAEEIAKKLKTKLVEKLQANQ